MTPDAGPAPWAGVHHLPVDVQPLLPVDEWAGWLRVATDVLWAATGRRWRTPTEETAAIHLDRCECLPARGGWAGGAVAAVRLPRGDVTAVVAVTVDGAPFTAWRLDGPWLHRTDEYGWPGRGRAVVTYRYGRRPPLAAQRMVAKYAAELGKGASGSGDVTCALPDRVTSVTRQGLTYALDADLLDKGLTGLTAVDAWIRSVNPGGLSRPARVWAPAPAIARRVP